MTLVVAQKTENGILSISDTKLTFEDSRTENPYFGALKSHIIGMRRSLHFAGNTYWVEPALNRIVEKCGSINKGQFEDVINSLLEINRESSGDIDFLLVDSGKYKISKISDSSYIADCERAYIGNPEAYQNFAANFEDAKRLLGNNNIESRYLDFTALLQAFKKVITDGNIASVGGLDVSIMQQGNYLFYQQKVEVDIGPMTLKVGREPVKIPFGSAANGSHSVNFLSSKAGEWPQCLGVHLHFGNIGILWGPGHHVRPIVITKCTHDSLVEIAEKAFDASITGIRID